MFEGHPVDQGIMIDYDKDARAKRNRAFTGQIERGAFTHGLGHEAGLPAGLAMAAATAQHHAALAGGGGSGPPRDETLELINRLKAEHATAQGVEVHLLAPVGALDSSSAELERARREQQRAHRSGGRPPAACFDFKAGRCDRGDSCRYLHGPPGKAAGGGALRPGRPGAASAAGGGQQPAKFALPPKSASGTSALGALPVKIVRRLKKAAATAGAPDAAESGDGVPLKKQRVSAGG